MIERFWECLADNAATGETNIKVCKAVNIKMCEVVQLTLFADPAGVARKDRALVLSFGVEKGGFLLHGVKAGFS